MQEYVLINKYPNGEVSSAYECVQAIKNKYFSFTAFRRPKPVVYLQIIFRDFGAYEICTFEKRSK